MHKSLFVNSLGRYIPHVLESLHRSSLIRQSIRVKPWSRSDLHYHNLYHSRRTNTTLISDFAGDRTGHRPTYKMSGIIDLTSDDESVPSRPPMTQNSTPEEEDEDLKLAIALSLQDQTNIEEASKPAIQPNESLPEVLPERTRPSSSSTGLLGLDRKVMEAERLARLKRKRDPDTDLENSKQPPNNTSNLTNTRVSPPPPRRQKPNPSTQPEPTASNPPLLTTKPAPTFPTPQILLTSDPSRLTTKSTPTSISPQSYTSISLPDILTPPHPNLTLRSTLLSSFIADLDWLFQHFDTRATNFLLLLHAQTPQHRAFLESDFAGLSNVKLVVPEVMGGSGNMHSKVMLLFYQGRSKAGAGLGNADADETNEVCRIVIPSANLTRADWGVGGVMENILFVVDLPLKTLGREQKTYPFGRKLKIQLSAMGVPESVLRKLERFDFAATRYVDFVYSRSGSNVLDSGAGTVTQGTMSTKSLGVGEFFQRKGKASQSGKGNIDGVEQSEGARPDPDDPARTGLLSLQDAVISLGLDVPVTDLDNLPQVDFITSSLGNLTSQFVRQLYLAICGQLDPAKTTVASKRPNKNTNTKSADTDAALDEMITRNLKIYFPTSETVHRSKGGPSAGGTICFQSKWWDSSELIRKCLHDCVGVRKDGILMHSKVRDHFFSFCSSLSNLRSLGRKSSGVTSRVFAIPIRPSLGYQEWHLRYLLNAGGIRCWVTGLCSCSSFANVTHSRTTHHYVYGHGCARLWTS